MRNDRLFNRNHRYKLPKFKRFGYVTDLSPYSPELYPNSKLLTAGNFSTFDSEIGLDDNNQLYTNNKVLNYLFYKTYINVITSYSKTPLPLMHTQVMNMFTSNFDESVNIIDTNSDNNPVDTNTATVSNNNELRSYNNLKLRETCKGALKLVTIVHQIFNTRFTDSN